MFKPLVLLLLAFSAHAFAVDAENWRIILADEKTLTTACNETLPLIGVSCRGANFDLKHYGRWTMFKDLPTLNQPSFAIPRERISWWWRNSSLPYHAYIDITRFTQDGVTYFSATPRVFRVLPSNSGSNSTITEVDGLSDLVWSATVQLLPSAPAGTPDVASFAHDELEKAQAKIRADDARQEQAEAARIAKEKAHDDYAPDHNYLLQQGYRYGYGFNKPSATDMSAAELGFSTQPIAAVYEYWGKRAGYYTFAQKIPQTGSVILFQCRVPCSVAKTTVIRADGTTEVTMDRVPADSIIARAFADAINGKLKLVNHAF